MAWWNFSTLLATWLLLTKSIATEYYEKCEIRKYLLAFSSSELLEVDLVTHEVRTLFDGGEKSLFSFTVDSSKKSPVIYLTKDGSLERITLDEYSEPQSYQVALRDDIDCYSVAFDEGTGNLYCGSHDEDLIWEITNSGATNASFTDPDRMKSRDGYIYIGQNEITYRGSVPITSTTFTIYQRMGILTYIEGFFVDENYFYWIETNRENSSLIFQRGLSDGYIRQLPLDIDRKHVRSFTVDNEDEILYYWDYDKQEIIECDNFQEGDSCKTLLSLGLGLAYQMDIISHRYCEMVGKPPEDSLSNPNQMGANQTPTENCTSGSDSKDTNTEKPTVVTSNTECDCESESNLAEKESLSNEQSTSGNGSEGTDWKTLIFSKKTVLYVLLLLCIVTLILLTIWLVHLSRMKYEKRTASKASKSMQMRNNFADLF